MAGYARLLHCVADAVQHSGDWRGAQFALCADLLQRVRTVWRNRVLATVRYIFGRCGGDGRLLYATAGLHVPAVWKGE